MLSGGRMKRRRRDVAESSGGRETDRQSRPKRSKDPAKHVSKVLRHALEGGHVDEVFPGLRSGSSAGLVAVTLPDAKSRRATLKALREDDAIGTTRGPIPRTTVHGKAP